MRDRPNSYRVRSLQDQLRTLLAERAGDEAFKANLIARLEYSDNTSRNREIRHFLSTLESYRRWWERLPTNKYKAVPDTMNVFDMAAISLEHIYPRNAPAGRQDPAMEPLKQRLANLTIMAASDNSAAENAPFNTKKMEYARSSVSLTRRLADFTEWTPAEFGQREGELLDMALAIFKIS